MRISRSDASASEPTGERRAGIAYLSRHVALRDWMTFVYPTTTWPRPQTGAYARALARYRAADPEGCLHDLDGRNDPRDRLLAARATLRAGRPDDALRILASVPSSDLAEAAVRETLRIVAATRLGDFRTVAHALGAARAYTISTNDPAQAADLEYVVARAAVASGDLDLAHDTALGILDLPTDDPTGGEYVVPLAHTRARAFALLQRLETYRGRYDPAYLLAALGELDRAAVPDLWIASSVLRSLAALVQDLGLPQLVPEIGKRFEGAVWSRALAAHRLDVSLSLGWSAALRGDDRTAFNWFDAASAAASDPAGRCRAEVARARFSSAAGDRDESAHAIGSAARLAQALDWSELTGGARTLANLAVAAARLRPDLSRWALAAIRPDPAAAPGVADPESTFGIACAEGRIARQDGDAERAVSCLRTAFETAERVGFRWRAHEAAIDLAEIGAGEHFLTYARREAERMPASWLGRRTAALAPPA